jgi:hypothetical protein
VQASHTDALLDEIYTLMRVAVVRTVSSFNLLPLIVRQLIDEWRPRYMAARTALRDLRRRREPLILDALPLPPGGLRVTPRCGDVSAIHSCLVVCSVCWCVGVCLFHRKVGMRCCSWLQCRIAVLGSISVGSTLCHKG